MVDNRKPRSDKRELATDNCFSIGYHVVMISMLGTLLVRILEALFAIGVFGSALVLLLTFVEDIETLFGLEESHHS